jgi:hypothetical protein
MGHVVRSSASGARNVDALFFIPGWAQHGSHNKRIATRYTVLVFLHLVASTTCSALWCIRGVKHRHTIFYAWVGPVWIPQKAHHDTLCQTYVFASGGICRSHSALWFIQGAKCRHTIFHSRLGPVQIPQKAHRDTLH